MFSHTKRHYCKFFDYWKYSLKDGTYFAKEYSEENLQRMLTDSEFTVKEHIYRENKSFTL